MSDFNTVFKSMLDSDKYEQKFENVQNRTANKNNASRALQQIIYGKRNFLQQI